ncbi:ATP-binding cassette domain-containing protein [Paenibacillus spiritus]|uniref:ATP-binding cassette domain-containing protein n=1 Tax=Paenibacillus spiritus TaxID=2496557 RepID=UPI001CC5C34C|nr:ATP-binding cassette domain-containing protein [Paenibacillus spiritus]
MWGSYEDLSLDVNRGEVLAIVGKNGSGKSTLLKLIAGLAKPDHGRIVFQRCLKGYWIVLPSSRIYWGV